MKFILLCVILFSIAAHPASAQMENQTEAQKLQETQAENQKLRDELAAAQKRIKELEAAAAKPTTPPNSPTPASIQANPAADFMGNPIAVLDFFNKKFAQDMAKKRVALPQEKDNKATRQAYLAKAKDWLDAINRTTYSIDWRGRVTELGAANGPNQEFAFQCISPDNKLNYGRVTFTSILKSNAPQFASTVPDKDVIWKMTATLEPLLDLAPEMLEPNTFDNPPLVGPCVTFKYKLSVGRLYTEKNSAQSATQESK
jgi:hypothetical protein